METSKFWLECGNDWFLRHNLFYYFYCLGTT